MLKMMFIHFIMGKMRSQDNSPQTVLDWDRRHLANVQHDKWRSAQICIHHAQKNRRTVTAIAYNGTLKPPPWSDQKPNSVSILKALNYFTFSTTLNLI